MVTSKPFISILSFFAWMVLLSGCSSSGAPLAVPSATTTVPAPRPSPTFVSVVTLTPQFLGVTPVAIRGTQWSETTRGLTIGLGIEPFPPQMASATNYRVNLLDASGQPVTDATVEMSVVAGEMNMEGEHDETHIFKLEHQGSGVYSVRTSVSGMNQALVSISLAIKRRGESWDLSISHSELGMR